MLNPKKIANLHATSHIQQRCGAFKSNFLENRKFLFLIPNFDYICI